MRVKTNGNEKKSVGTLTQYFKCLPLGLPKKRQATFQPRQFVHLN